MTQAKQYETYAEVKARLDEIVEAVKDDSLPLDDALDLYEEAVSLGLRVSDMLEDDIEDDAEDGAGGADENGAAADTDGTAAEGDLQPDEALSTAATSSHEGEQFASE